jgi:hypothetical protein
VIATIVMLSVVVLVLAVALEAARRSRYRQAGLERENEAMQRELERHRQAVHSILRELQNP